MSVIYMMVLIYLLYKTRKSAKWRFIRAPCMVSVPPGVFGLWSGVVQRNKRYEIEILCFGILMAVTVWYAIREQKQKATENEKRRLLLEYPEFVSKLSLLIGAGMTIHGAFKRMDLMYQKMPEKTREKLHPAYARVHQMLIEIENGKSEKRAYQSFGKSCNLQPYRKLSSVLISCQQMGNRKLMERLTDEADRVYLERKNTARKLGEEAGTKMLFPMMLMMVLVMGIVLLPAFLSLNF